MGGATSSSTSSTSSSSIEVDSSSTSITSSEETSSSTSESSSEEISSSSKPQVVTNQVRRVPIYPTFNGVNPVSYVEVHHFNGESVGYIDLKDWFEAVINSTLKTLGIGCYSLTQKGTIFTITNNIGSETIDFDTQTITYENYDGYNIYQDDYLPYRDLEEGGEPYFVMAKSHSKYDYYPSVRTISLADYDIPMYYLDGVGYLPLEIIDTYLVPVTNGLFKYTYTGAAIYAGEITSKSQLENAQEEAEYYSVYDSDYMEYTYNLLALNLDFFYGLDKKVSLVDPTYTKTYLTEGAYAAIAPYHDRLVSLETNVANGALIEVITNVFDDGGHSGYLSPNILCDENYYNPEFKNFGDQIQYRWDLTDKMKEAREEAGYGIAEIVNKQTGLEKSNVTNCYYEEGGVAYFSFDSFDGADGTKPEIDIQNYWTNTIYATHYANEQLHREGAPKNLVIDLSVNGGGTAFAEQFIASWLCDGITTVIRDAKDKTFCAETVYADVDFDGDYDEMDCLPDDVNVYCIINQVSFSCGNLLPWHLKEQRVTRFIGDRTGGGSCIVKSALPSGLGSFYQISGLSQLGSVHSTSYDDFYSVEDGVEADWYQLPTSVEENIAKYYDHTEINKRILAE